MISLKFKTRLNKGSALVLTLMLSGILAITVAVMLYMVTNLSRTTNDKLAYEEAYHVARAGLAVSKAFLQAPSYANAYLTTGSVEANAFQAMTNGSIDLATWAREDYSLVDSEDEAALAYTTGFPDKTTGYDLTDPSGGRPTGDGRKVLWTWHAGSDWEDTEGKVVKFGNDARTDEPAGAIFGADDGSEVRGYVSRVRFTTPYTGSTTYDADNINSVTIIAEAEAIVKGTGKPKRRILQQKFRIVPNTSDVLGFKIPPLGSGQAIISGGSVTVGGASSLKVHWGPVWASTSLELLGLNPLSIVGNKMAIVADNKFYGSGIADTTYGGTVPGVIPLVEKWLRWQTAGTLTAKPSVGNAAPMFPANIGGVPVIDFFSQLQAGEFKYTVGGVETAYTVNDLTLSGDYKVDPKLHGGNGVFWDADPEQNGGLPPIGTGALVQHPDIAKLVKYMTDEALNYNIWKFYAIAMNGYAKPKSGGGFTNADGDTLYLTADNPPTLTTENTGKPFTSLKDITMAGSVNQSNGSANFGDTSHIRDRILFIDTPEGTSNGTPVNLKVVAKDNFFWKGLFYLNGSMEVSGQGAAPTIRGKNPDQYAANPRDNSDAATHDIANCIMDGILFVTGSFGNTGNPRVYGSMVSKVGQTGTGTPEVFFNTRLKAGLFQDAYINPATVVEKFAVITGPMVEIDSFAGW